MKRKILLIPLICIAAWSGLGELDPEKRYTIIGKYVPIDEDPSYAALANPLSEDEQEENLSAAEVVVFEETTQEDGEALLVEISRGVVSNGRVVLEGEIDEPIFAKITVQTSDSKTLSVRTLLAPRQVVSFALLDHQGRFPPDQMVLVGESRRAKDPNNRFTIIGDLTGIDETQYPMPRVSVRGSAFDEDGNWVYRNFGTVQTTDGSFLIEGEVDEPRFVTISVSSNMGLVWGSTEAIIEPNAVISVVVSAHWVNRLAAAAGAGKHAKLIDTWRMSEQYLATEKALDEEFKKLRTETAPIEENDTEAETENNQTESESIENRQEAKEKTESAIAIASAPAPAIGCEHVEVQWSDMSEEQIESADSQSRPPWLALQDELREIRNAKLQQIAFDSEDPFDSLLALEMNPFQSSEHQINDAPLPVYEKLMSLLDEDIVDRRVRPRRDELAMLVARDRNNKALVPGQKAPTFSLPALEGNEVSLTDVLHDNKYVYIDFWASWCTPCIEDFPELKDLHASYSDDGFEVLTISVDDTHDEWKEAAEKIEFPWIDVGSLGGTETETPVSYGVQGIPKGFLVDKEGCIVQKDIRPDRLKNELATRYAEPMTTD
ncbi:MAG: TlpA disulfide reductase family protein [Gammaproteobacteria bacterium]|nr:TlpA disulfide reductase family protein [Gammaproteobacteria bacterium]MDE0252039.1 TlpA disulfide reductase family protein [Gammaproteobacteria bacterium]MDE0402852.1 TlpA disulfide reductase family protein [Gammaproteobacteria bacterium]